MDINEMSELNRWWTEGRVPLHLAKRMKRDLFPFLWDMMDKRQIVSIVGLRRVGKSTLMFQLIDRLIVEGTDPRNILYFTFDIKGHGLKDVLKTFREDLQGQMDGRKYIFLDEIQKLDGWAESIKVLYDLDEDLKFVISGSSGMEIEATSGSVLAGRILKNTLRPLSFLEFLRFSGKKEMAPIHSVDGIKEAMLEGRTRIAEMVEYAHSGGFIEIIGEEKRFRSMYVRSSVVDNIINKDLKELEGIKDTDLVREMLKIFSSNPGMIVDLSSLGDDLGISRQTVSKYLRALLSAYCLIRVYSYHRNFLTSSKKAKRIYLAHPCIIESFDGEIDTPEIGRVIENVMVSNLDPVFFYRDGNKEIDIIARDRDMPLPVEVKYSSKIDGRDLRTISWFVEKRDLEMGIVATKDLLERRGRILLVPAFILLSMENWLQTCKDIFHSLE
ncbi:MAG: ATP-binding protein [Candidatus Thermoplasmatota archaeon]|nr:ATP-binding protein [Candidatus Thermoplasmatota archaeon]